MDTICCINPCLLDSSNTHLLVDGERIGARIAAGPHEHLWSDRPPGVTVDVAVVHYISAVNINSHDPFNMERVLGIFVNCDVSSHYLIDREGEVYQLVPEIFKAWHSGGSIMPAPDNRRKVNDFSIGIELMATESSGFKSCQYNSLAILLRQIRMRHPISSIVGHEDIAGSRAVFLGLRQDVKPDPGARFDWALLNRLRQGVSGGVQKS